MANWTDLKTAITTIVRTNGVKAITGQLLQDVLLQMVNNLGGNPGFGGTATISTDPGNVDGNVFYLVSEPGIYPNFGNIQILPGEVGFLTNNSGTWVKQSIRIGSYSGVVDAKMANTIPTDDIVMNGGGVDKANDNIFSFDPQKNGWYINVPIATKSDGQHLYAMRNVPFWYDENLPYNVSVEIVVAYKNGTNFPFKAGFQIANRAGGVLNDYAMNYEALDTTADGYDRIIFRQNVNLKTIADSTTQINSKSYILLSAYFQHVISTTAMIPAGLELYIESRRISVNGLTNRDYKSYTEQKALIQGNGFTLPFAVNTVAYENADGDTLYYGNATDGMTIEPGDPWRNGEIVFDTYIPLLRVLNDKVGKAFYLRVKFGGDNFKFGNNLVRNLDDYIVNAGFTNTVSGLSYIIPGTMEYVIKCYAADINNLRILLPANVQIIDPTKTTTIKLQSITLMQYNADMLEKDYENWTEAIAKNGGDPIRAIDDWAKNSAKFPLKVLFDGEGFYGAENNRTTGRLFVPRRTKQVNPNYIAAQINKDVFKSMVRVGADYVANGTKTLYVSWFVMYKIKGHGLDNKDDFYYNSEAFIGSGAPFTGGAGANGGATLATGKQVYFLPKDFVLKNGEPFFIVQYEFHFNVDAIMAADTNIQMFAMMSNVALMANCPVDIEVQSLSAWGANLDFPFVDDALSRAIKYAQYADQTINIPNNIGLSAGAITVRLTETRGLLLEGDTGTADKTAPEIAGYISVNEVAQHDGAVTGITINSPVAQTVDLVVGLIDQNNIIVPGVVVEGVELVAGQNIIGYYNDRQSPLPIKTGERLFIRQNTANVIPYMDKTGASYVYADNIANPTVTTVNDRQLDFRYIIEYIKKPKYEVPTRGEFEELTERVDAVTGERDAIPIYSPNGSKWYIRVRDDGTVYADRNTFSKLCIIGNSITWHGIVDYWWGTWGLAATVREKDYAHLILAQAQKGNPDCTLDYFNFVLWETATTSAARSALLPEYLDEHLALNPDCIIIRLCENVQPAGTPTLQQDYQTMLQYIKSKVPNAKIYCGGSFWVAPDKDNRIKAACDAEGVSFSFQSQLDTPENRSAIGTQVYGDDGQWHTINHSGVANHPGDKGMEAIANVFINQMEI